MDRVILHCDLNSFYASVELLNHPELRGDPVAVSGNPSSRHGIILATNEPAKKFGVKTAETIWQARKKCPNLVLLRPHHDLYRIYSKKVNAIYDEYTDLVSVGSGPTYAIPANRTTNPYNLNYIKEDCIERFNELYSRLSSKGVKMYMSFAPTDGDYCVDAVWSEETQDAFRDKLQGFLDYPVISHPGDYLLSHSLMYNSQYHPTGEGRRVRTEQLIADLKAQMIKEGIWQE